MRIWKGVRTQEQLPDNLFGPLKGERDSLLAYDELESDPTTAGHVTTLHDSSRRGNTLTATAEAEIRHVLSTAPLSDDIALVCHALGSVRNRFQGSITSRPAIEQYTDIQTAKTGAVRGVHKRCCSFVHHGRWHRMRSEDNSMAREIAPDERYQDKVVKLIPTEIIGAYLFISTGILEITPASPSIPQDLETKVWILVVSMVLLALTPMYLRTLNGVRDVVQLTVTTISFLVWIYSLGGPFVVWGWGHSPKVAGSVLVLWSLIPPLFVTPHEPPAGSALPSSR